MAEAARKVEPNETMLADDHKAIIAEVAENPAIVLTDERKFTAYFEAVRAQINLEPGDMTTAKGRDIIKANAASVARKKTAIDNARKQLTEGWRKRTASVNEVGKLVVEKFDALRDQVRAPLTAWEEREEVRKAEAQNIIDDMLGASIIREGETAQDLRDRLDRIRGRNLSDEMFGPRIEMVTDLRDSTVQALLDGIARIEQSDRDRAELQRLRDEAEQRAREDEVRKRVEEVTAANEARAKAEAEEQATREAAQQARIEQERAEAADAARREAEKLAVQRERDAEAARQAAIEEANRQAQDAREEAARAAQAEIDAANARAAAVERERQEERARAIAAEHERMEAIARTQREQAEREADQAHRDGILKRAATVLTDFADIDIVQARAVVAAIADGNIPAVSISF